MTAVGLTLAIARMAGVVLVHMAGIAAVAALAADTARRVTR